MIGLASGLVAIAGLFAERAIAVARSDRLAVRLGVRPRDVAPRARNHMLFLGPAIAAMVVAIGPVIGVGAIAGAVLVGSLIRRRRRSVLRYRAAEQTADAVSAVSAGLRAGLSLPQAFAYARDEAEEPSRRELAALVDAVDTGTPFGEALQRWAVALGTEDALLIVGVLDLHRRSGGDLPIVLDGLAGTLRERRAAQREVRALTAQARLSGVILGMLPLGFFGFLLLTSRREMLDAIATPLGGTALGVGLGLEVLAFLWIRHLLEVR
jgi:tight adherence protein B